MLKLLGKFFNKVLTSLPEPIEPKVYDDGLKELTPAEKAELSRRKKNLRAFIKAITPHLNETESQRLARMAAKAIDDEFDSLYALEEAMSCQKRGQWVFIYFEWKAVDEIAWQVSEILDLYDIKEKWTYTNYTDSSETVNALNNLSKWLNSIGFSLVHVKNSGDDYCHFIVKTPSLPKVKELASIAEIKIDEWND